MEGLDCSGTMAAKKKTEGRNLFTSFSLWQNIFTRRVPAGAPG
jgi:hypothetical protein